jgi:hypothetical protein
MLVASSKIDPPLPPPPEFWSFTLETPDIVPLAPPTVMELLALIVSDPLATS